MAARRQILTSAEGDFADELKRTANALPERIDIDPSSVEHDLARLVLSLIELVRRLLEKQAVRRMEGGGLDDRQVEDLGLALMRLEAKMDELKSRFGLEGEDLNLNLGPIGRLI